MVAVVSWNERTDFPAIFSKYSVISLLIFTFTGYKNAVLILVVGIILWLFILFYFVSDCVVMLFRFTKNFLIFFDFSWHYPVNDYYF